MLPTYKILLKKGKYIYKRGGQTKPSKIKKKQNNKKNLTWPDKRR